MSLIYKILLLSILFITSIIIIIYDSRIKRIPMWLLIINYSVICFLVNNLYLLFGILFILFIKYKNYSIDILYIFFMIYLIIIVNNYYINIVNIIIMLCYIIISKDDKLSFMVPLEICILLNFFIKEILL